MSIELLTQALQAAKAAAKADKSNAQLKAAKNAAKAALDAAVAKQAAKAAKKAKKEVPTEAPPAKKAKKAATKDEPTLESLQAALASAKAAKKSLKNEESKVAFKAAKAALEAFQAKGVPTETQQSEPEPKDEVVEENAGEEDELASLKKKAKKPAAVSESGAEPNEKVFVGNLSWDVDDDGIKEFFKDCGSLTDIFWLTDKETQKFKGCGFLTFESTEAATKAVAKAGEELLGRPIKIDFSKPRPGGDKGAKGTKKGGGAKGGKKWEPRPLSERPDDCTTVFCGNLSFEIDEDAMYKFAEGCGEVTSIRWLTDKASGDFKGCGFVEFDSPESVDKFVLKNGQDVAGRPIHIDYASKRPPKKEF